MDIRKAALGGLSYFFLDFSVRSIKSPGSHPRAALSASSVASETCFVLLSIIALMVVRDTPDRRDSSLWLSGGRNPSKTACNRNLTGTATAPIARESNMTFSYKQALTRKLLTAYQHPCKMQHRERASRFALETKTGLALHEPRGARALSIRRVGSSDNPGVIMHTHPNHPENQKARMRQSPGFRQGKEPITRGVWIAPWEGPNGEIILMAITREVRLVGTPLTVPLFADAAPYIESLWNQLDEADPLTRAPNPGTRPKLTIVR